MLDFIKELGDTTELVLKDFEETYKGKILKVNDIAILFQDEVGNKSVIPLTSIFYIGKCEAKSIGEY